MKKLVYLLLFAFTSITVAQTKGITYQAVLYDPEYPETTLPGPDNGLIPYANKAVCIKFEITNSSSQKIYVETQTTKTDAFGMVNVIIGQGTRIGGLVNSFELINWNNQASGLIVSIDKTSNCNNFTQVSNQPFTATPFSLGNSSIKTELFELVANKSTDITTDATSDTKYPSVKAIKNYVDGINAAGVIDATKTTKGKIQLGGDLAGFGTTAAAPIITSGAITADKLANGAVTADKLANGAISTDKIGSIDASKITGSLGVANGGTGATTVAGTLTNLGLNNVNNTADIDKPVSNATQTALNLKEDTANKSTNVTTDGTSDTKYPSVKAIKDYVDTRTTPDATTTDKGKIQLGGDLAGFGTTAAAPIITSGAITADKLANGAVTADKLANGAISTDKIGSIDASKITGSLGVANGGTGATTVAGTLTNLGLNNVNNTADIDKPVSNATQTALNLKEDTANKSTNVTTDGTSDTKYPSVKAIKDYVDTRTTPDATTTDKGKIQLGGDLAGFGTTAAAPIITSGAITADKLANGAVTADKLANGAISTDKIGSIDASKITGSLGVANGGTGATTVAGTLTNLGLNNVNNTADIDKPVSNATQTALNLKEDTANKSTNVTTDGTSDTKYPSVKAIKDYVDTRTTPDATTTDKGKIQLGGDLAGFGTTAAAPIITSGAITADKLANGAVTADKLANGAISTDKIGSIDASKITGSLGVANGGTGATTVAGTLTNLGLNNVNNTADIDKPVSNATQTALNLKEDTANKSTNVTTDGTSDTKYPSVKAIKDYVDTRTTPDATTTDKGKIQLGGDLAGFGTTAAAPIITSGAITADKLANGAVTADKLANGAISTDKIGSIDASKITGSLGVANGGTGATTVAGTLTNLGLNNVNNTADIDKPVSNATQTALNLKEDTANKSTNVTTDGTSDTKYPSVKAIKDYVDTRTTPDATTTDKGKIQLGGDLAGFGTTAAAPIITSGAITADKLANGAVTADKLANGAISTDKIGSIDASKITGSLGVANGGTGATTVAGTLTNLGLNNVNNTADIDKPVSNATQTALNLKEDTANKSTNVTTDGTSDTKYPSVKAIKDYVDTRTTPDATTTDKGKIQLGGDLAGFGTTAAAPIITSGAITADKLANGAVTADKLANGAISTDKIGSIDASKITGSLGVANGGTGATTVAGTLTNLGLNNVNNTADIDKPVSNATQTALNLKEDTANKSTNVTTDGTSDTKYPSVKAIKDYVDTRTTPDATTTDKGKIQLGGDLAGFGTTAAAPIITSGAITKAKLAATGGTAGQVLTVDAAGTGLEYKTPTTYTAGTSMNLNGTSFERAALTGDVTAALNSNTTTIANSAVTTAKIADSNVTKAKLAATGGTAGQVLTVDAAGTGLEYKTPTTYTAGTSMNLNGTSFERAALTGDVTAALNSNTTTIANSAVTTAKIADSNVTKAKLAATGGTAGQVLTVDAAGTGLEYKTPTTYTAGTSMNLNGTSFERAALTGDVTAALNSNTTTIANSAVTTAKIADSNVTKAKLAATGGTAGQVLTVDAAGTGLEYKTPTTYTAGTSMNLNGTSFERAALTGDVTAALNSNTTTIANSAVTTAKIADSNVTKAKLAATGGTAGQVLTVDAAGTGLEYKSIVVKGVVNCAGTLTQTIADTNVTATAAIIVTYEDSTGNLINITLKNRTVGTSFEVSFANIPPTSAKINYIIVP